MISNDIDPGPANIGIDRGVREMSDLEYASSFSLFFIPLCLLKFPVSNAKPDDAMIIPPVILKDAKLIPKNLSR